MKRQKALLMMLIVSVVLLFFHFIALKFHLYWTLTWFDIITHFLGGFFLGIFGLILFTWLSDGNFQMEKGKPQILSSLAFSLVFALMVGTLWEVWELYHQMVSIESDGPDTLADLIVDSVGALIGYFSCSKILWKKN